MPVYSNEALFKALKELAVIDERELAQAYSNASREKKTLGEVLLERELIGDENLGAVVADIFNVPFVRLSQTPVPDDVLKILPASVARKNQTIIFKRENKEVQVATSNPLNKEIKELISKKTGFDVVIYYATPKDINRTLSLYNKDIQVAFSEIINQNVQEAKGKSGAEPPIIKIVDTLFSYAFENNASDIHIEPLEDLSLVRFRVDGVLEDVITLPLAVHPRIVTRIKVLSSLRTDEHQTAQDGKISYRVKGEDLDIRVSIVPITNGEKIVMRLLSEHTREFSITDLGFSATNLAKVRTAYQKPHGMILSTGPTGSGKTTSLYAILKILNRRSVNVMTIEDPVEYDVRGVNQIQVNEKTGLTFSSGLRSIVRQDPDIVLVGEIRDEDTADIAINAAMTGHLLLSTLHTNNAAGAMPRLIDMKAEPFLIASTVNVVIAQRLVRKLCIHCRYSVEEDASGFASNISASILKKYLRGQKKVRLYKGKGCAVCRGSGYSGRIGIFEVLIVEENIREAIIAQDDASVIQKIAVKNGMVTMLEDGIKKVTEALTTIDEVLRVTKE